MGEIPLPRASIMTACVFGNSCLTRGPPSGTRCATVERAFKGIRNLDSLKDMKKNGELLPEPLSTKKFTGEPSARRCA
jgi:hypothetical protein